MKPLLILACLTAYGIACNNDYCDQMLTSGTTVAECEGHPKPAPIKAPRPAPMPHTNAPESHG